MENSNTLERLNGQINALIGALEEVRDENLRLADELNACQAITRQREQSVHDLEESVGLKDMELEDLAVRIEQVLGNGSSTQQPAAAVAADAPGMTTAEPETKPVVEAAMA